MITYEISPILADEELNELFANGWDKAFEPQYVSRLPAESVWVVAFDQQKIVGFVKVVTDGGRHGFVLDTTTHMDYRNRGIGAELLRLVSEASKERGVEWLHVDFEAKHATFYKKAGFRHTEAGVKNLT